MKPEDAVHVMVGHNWLNGCKGLFYPSCRCSCHKPTCETCEKYLITNPGHEDLFLLKIALTKGFGLMEANAKEEDLDQFFSTLKATRYGGVHFTLLPLPPALYERLMELRHKYDRFYMNVATYALLLGAVYISSQARLNKAYEALVKYEHLGAKPAEPLADKPPPSTGPRASRFDLMGDDD